MQSNNRIINHNVCTRYASSPELRVDRAAAHLYGKSTVRASKNMRLFLTVAPQSPGLPDNKGSVRSHYPSR